MTEDNRIPKIRAAIADFEQYGTNGPRTPGQMLRDVSDILDSAPPAPRVFFPGDTVPAGTAVMLDDGSIVEGAVTDERWDINDGPVVELLGIPTRKEWQAAVDRAVNGGSAHAGRRDRA